jgi:hypothetical protein
MAQKPTAAPAPRKAEPAKKPAVKTPAAKPVNKASGARAATPGNLDALVNQHLAVLRNADQMLAEAHALVKTYGERYPELAAYLPEAAEERVIELREDAADEAAGSHHFRILIAGKAPRYERKGAGEDAYQQVEPAAWIQGFKDQLALRIAKVILAHDLPARP